MSLQAKTPEASWRRRVNWAWPCWMRPNFCRCCRSHFFQLDRVRCNRGGIFRADPADDLQQGFRSVELQDVIRIVTDIQGRGRNQYDRLAWIEGANLTDNLGAGHIANGLVEDNGGNGRERPQGVDGLARAIGGDDVVLCRLQHQLACGDASGKLSVDDQKTGTYHFHWDAKGDRRVYYGQIYFLGFADGTLVVFEFLSRCVSKSVYGRKGNCEGGCLCIEKDKATTSGAFGPHQNEGMACHIPIWMRQGTGKQKERIA